MFILHISQIYISITLRILYFCRPYHKLDQLENGDEIKVTSKDGKRITYEVKGKYPHVPADDMSYIEQKEDGIRRITLITCDQGGLTRLIVQAEEKQ